MTTLPVRRACALGVALLLHVVPTLADTDNKVVTSVSTLDFIRTGAPVSQPASLTSKTHVLAISKEARPLLLCQNKSPVKVAIPSTNNVLTFVLRNQGNAAGQFVLQRTNGSVGLHRHPHYVPRNSQEYDPANAASGAIFLESDHTPGFQEDEDELYVPGQNDPLLDAGGTKTIYVLSDTPLVHAGARGEVLLTATQVGGTPNPVPPSDNDDWWEDPPPAKSTASGSYLATGLGLLTSRSLIANPHGKSSSHDTPLTYRISVKLQGKGNAKSLVFSEPLPPNLSYVPNSIRINGLAQTDAHDRDRAYFIQAPKNGGSSIAVSLGNLEAPMSWTISFRATLK